LPKHAAISEYRPTIKKQRFTAFKGMRYRVGVSNLSTLSRVFYILSSLKGNYQNHGYRLIEEYGDYIKIEITLDTLDTPDSTSHKLVRTCGDCELFHKPSCVIPVMNFDKVPENATFALDCRSFTPKKEAS